MDEGIAQGLAVRSGFGEHPFEFSLEIGACARLGKRRHELPGAIGGRIERGPQLGGFERERSLPGEERDFGCAACERRIFGIARGLIECARGQTRLTSLQSDVADEYPIEDFRGQLTGGRGCGRRQCGEQPESEHGQDAP